MRNCVRKTVISRGLLVATLAAASAFAQQYVVRFDPAETQVSYVVPATLHTVHGTFRLRKGEVHFDTLTGKASGELVVDAASGDSGINGRDTRMQTSVLESSKYPDIVFMPDRFEGKVDPEGESQVNVHGNFTIHGAAHEMVLPVTIHSAEGQLTARTHFIVPYVSWGMKNPSTLLLRVNPQVHIEVRASGRISR